jgi:hypothetical protein
VGSLNEIWFETPSSAKGEMRFQLTGKKENKLRFTAALGVKKEMF